MCGNGAVGDEMRTTTITTVPSFKEGEIQWLRQVLPSGVTQLNISVQLSSPRGELREMKWAVKYTSSGPPHKIVPSLFQVLLQLQESKFNYSYSWGFVSSDTMLLVFKEGEKQ